MADLKSLDEHDAAVAAQAKPKPKPNGIACPVCAKELADTELLTSAPPMMAMICGSCGYTGGRLA